MTISLAAVFIPILFMGGIVGRLFREFAVVDRRRDPGLGLRVAVADADALQPVPEARGREREEARPLLPLERARLRRDARPLRADARAGARGTRAAILAMSAVVLVATGWLFVKIPKGFLPTEDQGLIFGSTEAAQGIGFPAMREKQQQIGAIVAGRPGRRQRPHLGRAARKHGGRQLGHRARAAEAPGGAHAGRPTRSSRSCGRSSRRSRGSARSCRCRRRSASAAARRRASTSTRSRTRTRRSSTSTRRSSRSKIRELPEVQDVTSDLQLSNPAAERDDRPRPRGRARHHDAEDRGRALHRLRHAPDLDDLRADQPVPGHHGARARVPGDAGGDRPALRARGHGRPRAALLARAVTQGNGPADRGPPGPASGRLDLVQPEPGRGARRRRGGGQPCRAPDAAGDRAARASRARPRRSRARSRGSGSCCSSRSS